MARMNAAQRRDLKDRLRGAIHQLERQVRATDMWGTITHDNDVEPPDVVAARALIERYEKDRDARHADLCEQIRVRATLAEEAILLGDVEQALIAIKEFEHETLESITGVE